MFPWGEVSLSISIWITHTNKQWSAVKLGFKVVINLIAICGQQKTHPFNVAQMSAVIFFRFWNIMLTETSCWLTVRWKGTGRLMQNTVLIKYRMSWWRHVDQQNSRQMQRSQVVFPTDWWAGWSAFVIQYMDCSGSDSVRFIFTADTTGKILTQLWLRELALDVAFSEQGHDGTRTVSGKGSGFQDTSQYSTLLQCMYTVGIMC